MVAEGGSNHGGSLDAALALTDAAAAAGADAMKWQLWLSADEMYDRAQFPTEWESADRWRLPVEWLWALSEKAHDCNMAFGLSSFGFAALDEADRWVDFHKVASIEAEWPEFVKAVSEKRKPTLISLGMSEATSVAFPFRYSQVVNLHCVVSYPADLEDVNLRSRPLFGLWGLSDHTIHPTIAPCAATSLGTCVIEKHIKWWDPHQKGTCEKHGGHPPDWNHSLSPAGFAEMVSAIRQTELALGSSEKRIRDSERGYLKYRRGARGLRGA